MAQPIVESRRLRVAWISDYPIEWMADLPDSLRHLGRQHPFTWTRVLLGEFQSRGDIDLHVVVLRSRIRERVSFSGKGARFHVMRAPGALRVLSLFWLDTLLIRKRLNDLQPDLVHAWGMERGAPLVASRLGYPYLVTMHGILEWIIRAIPSVHPYMKFIGRLEPRALRRARVVTAESRFAIDLLSTQYPKLQSMQVEHAPHRCFLEVQRAPASDAVHILAVGTISAGKGSDLLLRALDALKDEFPWQLTLVGDGAPAFLDELRRHTSAEAWARVRVKHGLTAQQVAAEMASATLLAHPTLVDNSPNAVKEAAVVGVPVVASRLGGIPDYISQGRNGLLFPAGDLDALTASLREALTHPLFSKGQVDDETWRKVRDYLSPHRMAAGFLQAYARVMEAWGRNPFEWSALN